MTDELIILLSTDWFLPYWQRIGVDLVEASKGCVQQGCRKIVSQMIGDADWMWQVDFSERRKHETDASFGALLRECASEEELIATRKEWGSRTAKDNNATWNWFHLNQIICSPRVGQEYPVLDAEIHSCVTDIWRLFDFKESDICDACSSSTADWDVRIHSVLGGAATLFGLLNKVLRDHSLQAFWNRLQGSLTSEQLRNLIFWYREMTVLVTRREQPDLIPSYVKQRSLAS
jgi:hypothetical protein